MISPEKQKTPSQQQIETSYGKYAQPLTAAFLRVFKVNESDFGMREKRLVDTFEVILKYITTMMICQYKKDGIDNPRISEQILKLSRPSLGMYSGLLRDLVKLFKTRPHNPEPIRQMIDLFHVEKKQVAKKLAPETFELLKQLSSEIDYPTPGNARTYKQLVDVLVTYRNKALGHAASSSRKELQNRLPLLSHLVNELMQAVAPAAQIDLIQLLKDDRPANFSKNDTQYNILIWNGLTPPYNKRISDIETLQWDHLYLNLSTVDSQNFLDIFPLCLACEVQIGQKDLYFLNEATKSKFEYISYGTGNKLSITSAHTLFASVKQAFDGLIVPTGDEDVLGYTPELFEVTEESVTLYNKALLSIEDENFDIAIYFLEQAVEKSPNFHEAVKKLAELQMIEGLMKDAHQTFENFLVLNPRDLTTLVMDGHILLDLNRVDQASSRLNEIEQIDPDFGESQTLKDAIEQKQDLLEEKPGDSKAPDEDRLILPYEQLCQFLPGTLKTFPRAACTFFVFILTIAATVLFFTFNDVIMAMTMISMGILLGSVIWATFRVRNLLKNSRRNFCAFLRPKNKQESSEIIYRNLVEPVFRTNMTATIALTTLAVFTTWLFSIITSYAPESFIVDAGYAIFCFLLSLTTLYLLYCIISYHLLLNKLKTYRIHFSLVQHPKLSIRYLSFLSRKLTEPLLWIYVVAAFTMYIGPFLFNIVAIMVFSLVMVMICFLYYNTIFLVRGIIVQNKWHLLSQFSVHFHEPFYEIIIKAKKESMDRLTELTHMKNFIDKIDVWAESKKVLISTSIFFLLILLFSTIIMSNAMTRNIMPKISRYANSVSDEHNEFTLPIKTDSSLSRISIQVKNVDDTVIAIWADSKEQLIQLQTHSGQEHKQVRIKQNQKFPTGVAFCDWQNGIHGELDLKIPFEGQEKQILLLAYNKVYHGFWGLGGGKLSYDLRVNLDTTNIFTRTTFVRMNTRELGYCALITLKIDKFSQKIDIKSDGGQKLDDTDINDYVKKIVANLDKEPDARADLSVSGSL